MRFFKPNIIYLEASYIVSMYYEIIHCKFGTGAPG